MQLVMRSVSHSLLSIILAIRQHFDNIKGETRAICNTDDKILSDCKKEGTCSVFYMTRQLFFLEHM